MTEVVSEGSLVPWWRRADWGALLVVLMALASSATSLGNGFAYDDVPIVQENLSLRGWRWPWAFLQESYWQPPNGALYRPVTIWLFSLQWQAADWSPLTFHVINVTAYVAAALLLLRLARMLMRPGLALVMAALWAAHPVHVEVVGNTVGQAELWVALATLVALGTLQRAATESVLRWRDGAVLLGSTVAALGAKENGVMLPVVIVAILLRRRQVGQLDATSAWRWVRAHGYLGVLYLAARFGVLGTLAGDAPRPELAGLDLARRLWVALAVRVTDARLLLLGGPLSAEYGAPTYPLRDSPSLWHVLAIAVLGLWAVVGARLARAGRPSWPVWMVAAFIAPTANVFFVSGVIVSERALFVPSIGVALAIGMWCDHVAPVLRHTIRPAFRHAAVAAAMGLAVFWASASAVRQLVWLDSSALVASSMIDAPTTPRWHRVVGLYFLRYHEFDRAEVHLRLAERLGPLDFHVVNGLRRLLEEQRRDRELLPYLQTMLSQFGPSSEVELKYIAALLRLRRFSEARHQAFYGRAVATYPIGHTILLQIAESALVATDTVTPTNLWAMHRRSVRRGADPILVDVMGGRLIRRPSAP